MSNMPVRSSDCMISTVAPMATDTRIEGARKQTRPRKHDLYIIFNAILYIIKNGCTWRDLPRDFPDYRVVYHYFSIWREQPEDGSPSVLDEVLKKIGQAACLKRREQGL